MIIWINYSSFIFSLDALIRIDYETDDNKLLNMT